MKVVVLGSNGMIGGGITRYLRELGYDVQGLNRENLSVDDLSTVEQLSKKLSENRAYCEADWVINGIGIVKQYAHLYSERQMNCINSAFPQMLSELTSVQHKKLLHISSDCVFSGEKGNYNEHDKPDATDIYGVSKAAGEIVSGTSLVIRTSTIGVENGSSHGLLSWYSAQTMPVKGYVNAIYSGISLRELSQSIHCIWCTNIASGLYNVSSEAISKFDLLNLLYILAIGPKPLPVKLPEIDRSLNDIKFRKLTHLQKPNWIEMSHHIKIEIEEQNAKKNP